MVSWYSSEKKCRVVPVDIGPVVLETALQRLGRRIVQHADGILRRGNDGLLSIEQARHGKRLGGPNGQ
ncbi:hypothetical protein GCM10020295_77260 [Streptomyces cinereospinus]